MNEALLQKSLNEALRGSQVAVIGKTKTPQTISYEVLAGGVSLSSFEAAIKTIAPSLAQPNLMVSTRMGTNKIYVDAPRIDRGIIPFKLYPSNNLSYIVGVDALGNEIIDSLIDNQSPHGLICGGSGSGKSTAINAIISNVIMTHSPDDVRFVLVDPKGVELIGYSDVPHCLKFLGIESVQNECKATIALLEAIAIHMDKRYSLMSEARVNHIDKLGIKLPKLIIVIDEFADIAKQAGKDFERVVERIAAKARASGIHLLLATQYPTADVVSSAIKQNCGRRLGYASNVPYASTAMELNGLSLLLGKGDGKFKTNTTQETRIQAPFISEAEVASYCEQVKAKYLNWVDTFMAIYSKDFDFVVENENDSKLNEARFIARNKGQLSRRDLQEELGLGYGSAVKLLSQLVDEGTLEISNGKAHKYVGGANEA